MKTFNKQLIIKTFNDYFFIEYLIIIKINSIIIIQCDIVLILQLISKIIKNDECNKTNWITINKISIM